MALTQSIDPSTLNLTGKPALSQVTPTPITSVGHTGMANPSIVEEKSQVSPAAGALLGGLLGLALNKMSGTTPTKIGRAHV